MRAALVACLLAAPVHATEHELAAFGPILSGCYEAAGDAASRTAWIGRMASACMAQESGQTTLGMSSCLSAEADVWDGFLNAEYRATRTWMKAADVEEAVTFPEFAVRAEKLLEAQRAWIAFRDAECALDFAEWGAGSMRTIAHADCRMRMTAERTLALRGMREAFQ